MTIPESNDPSKKVGPPHSYDTGKPKEEGKEKNISVSIPPESLAKAVEILTSDENAKKLQGRHKWTANGPNQLKGLNPLTCFPAIKKG
ncbi:MAG: hypothetical protein K1060chlam5_00565 [Candidatus Anoxychlamydiales bacterium]|nr:hypothetical protein [Candidatus Anoxychlamydiales bacterium]